MKCGEMLTKTLINDCHVVIKHVSVVKQRKSNHKPCKSVKILVYILMLFLVNA